MISVSAVWMTTQLVVTADFLDPIVNYLAYVGIDASNAKRSDVLKSIIAFIIYAVIATLYFIFFHHLVMRAWRFRLMPEFEKLIERISKYHSATARDINIMSAAIPPTKRNNSLDYIWIDFILIDIQYSFEILFEHPGIRAALFVKTADKATGKSYMALAQSSTFYDTGPVSMSFAEGEGFVVMHGA